MGVDPSRVIQGLTELSWRGLRAPCSDASYTQSNAMAEKKYIYLNAFSHEFTGRNSVECVVKLHFSNTLEEDQYPDNWNKWYLALSDGKPGTLQHPDIGKIEAVAKEFNVEFNAANTAGVDVTVHFSETRSDTSDNPRPYLVMDVDPIVSTISSAYDQAVESAAALSEFYGFADLSNGENVQITKFESKVTLADVLKTPGEILSRLRSAQRFGATAIIGQVNQILGSINQVIDALNEDSLDDVTGPSRWVLRNQLITLYYAVKSYAADKDRGFGSRRTGTHYVPKMTTLPDLADRLNNTVTDLMQLNKQFLGKPTVDAGSYITYYV